MGRAFTAVAERVRVAEIMTTRVVAVREDTPVREVAQLLDSHRISGLPVLDAEDRLVGVVSEYDLIAKPTARRAGEVMSRDVISVMEDTPVEDVRYLLVQRKIKRVPVLRGQRLVGIVSRADLVREIAQTWVCLVCGFTERAPDPPAQCPKCSVPSGFQPAPDSPPVPPCPACGRPFE